MPESLAYMNSGVCNRWQRQRSQALWCPKRPLWVTIAYSNTLSLCLFRYSLNALSGLWTNWPTFHSAHIAVQDKSKRLSLETLVHPNIHWKGFLSQMIRQISKVSQQILLQLLEFYDFTKGHTDGCLLLRYVANTWSEEQSFSWAVNTALALSISVVTLTYQQV